MALAKRYYLETMGCQMNVVDSEQVAATLEDRGWQQVSRPQEAGLILLNTCAVRDRAQRKVIGHLGRLKPLKAQRPQLRIGVLGCVAQSLGQELLNQLPYVDFVMGTHNLHRLPECLDAVAAGRRWLATDFLDAEERLAHFPTRRCQPGDVSRYVTVMQGCDNFCSYCVVPYVRGREISRPAQAVVAEVQQLVAQGAREITLIGQNVNSYQGHQSGCASFPRLLQEVHAVSGLERLRFTTSHPKDLSGELSACFAMLPKLAPHLHLALQSGSDRVLKAMGRGYTQQQYLDLVARLRQDCPQLCLSTDIIVGFPGETEADFAATLEAVQAAGFADAYMFMYSPRPGTRAAHWEDDVPLQVKKERFARLQQLQEAQSQRYWQQDQGRCLSVLVVGEKSPGQLWGRSPQGRIVHFAGDRALIGTLVAVDVTAVLRNSHRGQLAVASRQQAS